MAEPSSPWQINTSANLFFQSGIPTKLFTMVIQSNVDQPSYQFQFQTPIGFYIHANNSSGSASGSVVSIPNLSLQLARMEIQIEYNGVPVNSLLTYSFIVPENSGSSSTYSLTTFPTVSYDISTSSSASLLYYAGILSVSNIHLFTNPGNVYECVLTFYTLDPTTQSSVYTNKFTTQQNGVFCNLTLPNQIQNTVLHTPALTTDIPAFTLSATS